VDQPTECIADITDTLHLRDVAMATIFWLSIYGVHIGTTWHIRLNRPCAAAMRSCVKLLWPFVTFWGPHDTIGMDNAKHFKFDMQIDHGKF